MSNSLLSLRFNSAKPFVILISSMILYFSLPIFFFLHSVYLFSLKLSLLLINYKSELSLLIKYSQKILAPYHRETGGRKKLSWLFPSFIIDIFENFEHQLIPSNTKRYINTINTVYVYVYNNSLNSFLTCLLYWKLKILIF